ncbi:uncharacterized protein LOC143806148 isoform X2 [Ranitomeya variabilis]|uniref:uncharacterized protein LOC143806148 isoform X2 n=1 Tax=Ranitomeya variabilis TaxID=490064 RepID=UPI00405699B8
MEERMEQMEEKLHGESVIVKPDIESKIKEGKPVIITIPLDDECKSSGIYVISNTPTIKQESKPEINPLPQSKSPSEDIYVIPDTSPIKQEPESEIRPLPLSKSPPEEVYVIPDTSPIKQEPESEINPLPVRKSPPEDSASIIINIDDDEDEACYENVQQTPKPEKNPADWIIQDVITPMQTKNAQHQKEPVNVWFVKSMKVSNENQNQAGGNPVKNEHKSMEKKPGVNVLNSSAPHQSSHNAAGFLENQALHNGQASKIGAHPGGMPMEDHLMDEMEEKIQVCSECSMCFTSLFDLESHMKGHKEGSTWICSDCGKSYYTKSSLDRHQITHIREKPLKCYDCGKCFAKQLNFEMHLRLHAGEVLFPCTECEKLFNSKASCDRHIRAHKMERPHICPQCGKGFLYNGCLIRHLRVHTGERPFPCPECGRCFRQTSALNRHVKTHSGEKPYDCSECGKCFTHQSDMNRHKETHRREQHFAQCAPSNESSLPTYIVL